MRLSTNILLLYQHIITISLDIAVCARIVKNVKFSSFFERTMTKGGTNPAFKHVDKHFRFPFVSSVTISMRK